MFTKGDWTSLDFRDTMDLFKDGHFQIVGNNQRENVAIIPTHWDNAKANAHLIASAPDLYEACKQALIRADHPHWGHPTETILEQAIAKAEAGLKLDK